MWIFRDLLNFSSMTFRDKRDPMRRRRASPSRTRLAKYCQTPFWRRIYFHCFSHFCCLFWKDVPKETNRIALWSSWGHFHHQNRLIKSTRLSRFCPDFGHLGMDQYLLIPFLGGWTSIYQLFWCSPGVQGFDTLPSQFAISFDLCRCPDFTQKVRWFSQLRGRSGRCSCHEGGQRGGAECPESGASAMAPELDHNL